MSIADKIIVAWMRASSASYRAAREFNLAHTFAGHSRIGGMWMCPTCMKKHHCASWRSLSGRQFPACCEHEAGPRNSVRHAV